MPAQNILSELNGRVLTITLNRPDMMNTIDLDFAQSLCAIAEDASNDKSIGAIIITGAGNKAFCAGGDLASFHRFSPQMGAHLKQVTDYFHRAICLFAEMNAPVIAAVNGVAAGGGLSMVGFPEIAIASEHARFVSAYTKIGLTPDGSSSFFMPRIIGTRRYYEMVLTNKSLTADEALNWGLVSHVVKADELMPTAMKIAQNIAQGPAAAHKRIKRLVMSSFDSDLPAQLEREARFLAESADDHDGQSGISAFLNKSHPTFNHE